jgi:hypothetical protein
LDEDALLTGERDILRDAVSHGGGHRRETVRRRILLPSGIPKPDRQRHSG